jgi:hypothetical protein
MSGNGPSRPPEHGHTTIAVRPGGEIVPSEDVSLYGEPAAIVSEHLPSRLKIWSSLISDLRYISLIQAYLNKCILRLNTVEFKFIVNNEDG